MCGIINPKYNASYCTFIKGESTKAQKHKQTRKHNGRVCLCFPNKGHVISYEGNFVLFPFVFSFLIMRTYAAKCNAEI